MKRLRPCCAPRNGHGSRPGRCTFNPGISTWTRRTHVAQLLRDVDVLRHLEFIHLSTPQGTLLIGFRNPSPDGKALIVPLNNPDQVVDGERAKLGTPIELSLNGLGIRSFEYRESQARYLIVGGPYNDDGNVLLFDWSGKPSDAAKLIPEVQFGNLNPEAMFVYPGDVTAVQFLSDDGGRKQKGVSCKEMARAEQRFRGFSIEVR